MIKKGNQVQILCGKDKGKKGEIIEILKSSNKKVVKIFPMACHPMVMMLEFQMSSKFLQM